MLILSLVAPIVTWDRAAVSIKYFDHVIDQKRIPGEAVLITWGSLGKQFWSERGPGGGCFGQVVDPYVPVQVW